MCRSPFYLSRSARAVGRRASKLIRRLRVRPPVRLRRDSACQQFGEAAMKLPRRQFLHLAAAAATLPALSQFASAQSYPTRPVHLLEGFGAGGAPDIVARLIGQSLSDRLGQSFVIENPTGATGNIPTDAVVRAAPDG